ncbi:MAG: exodeoxyribonuclease VII large subunit [Corynebacterium sp.]|nr:exodeoxyribonuclease VII large subunit [Corynebacterium sp.]
MAAAPQAPEATAMPVREVNTRMKEWIERLGKIWVEGEIAQLNVKRTWRFSYITLRDTEEESSIKLTLPTQLALNAEPPLEDGARVKVFGKPAYYVKRGELSLWVTDIQPVGLGNLLARIEQLRQRLHAEGYTDPARKKPVPFLPHKVGLITGRGSAAERDVLSVAKDRWPQVHFEIRNTAVQGARAVPEIIPALAELDADPLVDVIIIARGGGSVEDLLPFSEEALQQAVIQCSTPVVSAIGHEPDHPILDDIADMRAATPTDAAKRVVPDVSGELDRLAELRQRSRDALIAKVRQQQQYITQIRSRPILRSPLQPLTQRRAELAHSTQRLHAAIQRLLNQEQAQVNLLRSKVSTLGPAATLERGYAIVQVVPRDGTPPQVVTSYEDAPPGSQLRIRVSDGSIVAAGMQAKPAD